MKMGAATFPITLISTVSMIVNAMIVEPHLQIYTMTAEQLITHMILSMTWSRRRNGATMTVLRQAIAKEAYGYYGFS